MKQVLLAAILVAGGIIIWQLSHVIVLVFAGSLLAVLLRGLADALSRHSPLPRGWSVAIVILAICGIVGTGAWLLGTKVVQQTDELADQIPQSIRRIEDYLREHSWGRPLVRAADQVDQQDINEKALQWSDKALPHLFSALAGIAFVLFAGLYGSIQPGIYLGAVVRLVPPEQRHRAREIIAKLGHILRWWLVGRFTSMAVVGVLTWIGLYVLGVPLALSLAIIAGLFSFVPIIGPITSVVPAALVALMEGPSQVLWVILIYLIVQFIESNLITPLVQQKTVSIPPLFLLAAQLSASALVGVLGVIFATPMAAAVAVIIEELYIRDMLHDTSKSFSE